MKNTSFLFNYFDVELLIYKDLNQSIILESTWIIRSNQFECGHMQSERWNQIKNNKNTIHDLVKTCISQVMILIYVDY